MVGATPAPRTGSSTRSGAGTHLSIGDDQERERRERACARLHRVNQWEFDVNAAAIAAHGLPLFFHRNMPMLPQVLTDALASGLVLQARIVDFWTGGSSVRGRLRVWLESRVWASMSQ